MSDDRRCSFGAGRPFVQPPDSDADMAADMENFVSLLLSFAENQRKSHQPKKKEKNARKSQCAPKKPQKRKGGRMLHLKIDPPPAATEFVWHQKKERLEERYANWARNRKSPLFSRQISHPINSCRSVTIPYGSGLSPLGV